MFFQFGSRLKPGTCQFDDCDFSKVNTLIAILVHSVTLLLKLKLRFELHLEFTPTDFLVVVTGVWNFGRRAACSLWRALRRALCDTTCFDGVSYSKMSIPKRMWTSRGLVWNPPLVAFFLGVEGLSLRDLGSGRSTASAIRICASFLALRKRLSMESYVAPCPKKCPTRL